MDRVVLRDERIVTVDGNDIVIAGGNLRRIGFVVSSPPTSAIFIRFAGAAASGFGLSISPGTLPLLIDEALVGTAVREEVHCISPGGAQSVYFLDLFLG